LKAVQGNVNAPNEPDSNPSATECLVNSNAQTRENQL